ncbi:MULTISPECIES: flagellar hook assembly protein FlgD [Zoogloea]|jgi:flagellar basal-body rod modification protein FlgD|uniref:Basal-body rod modification protein FlgD n=1 Tax=Zoogloea oleivorans TaxID=1552750 RepID=A0A6C2CBX8_9RHOO|nr:MULTISPECIES: flagellar hook assembly protein FlgD [Zoogloea]MBP8132895.1 flagellar hook assembly protein FlgD [Zoogloea sp.]MBT9497375.1 flagellar hook assembly protein FlgD [Zoogloea sp.]MDD2668479.1 flagellar hook assembly protein FlgD [Zoogloea sp.]MDY0037258.1 flagellar hook assembly protein FlgD [Zoogloea oleivorans]TYC50595.1 flagellar hook assembly protein FlgD [Zoogloea oleivorans]
MSTVNSTTSADVISSLQKSSTAAAKTDDAQSRFLKLLTEQLKNQDPLNPMDNAQMTSQLAQISTVSGIDKLNTTLTSMLENSQSGDVLQAAALVGKGVTVAGNELTLTSSKAYGGFELPSAADKVTVTVKDANGLEVRKMELGDYDAGIYNFAWDGLTTSGAQAVDGKYTMSVTATRGDTALKPVALQLSTVNSVLRTSSGGVSLDVGSGGLVSLSDIKQIL